ncbi:MAG: helix-turn-helix domain-containing protein [Candidatus Nezhaarchaeota archaeon]|nr:helix-turn-helix domain-containing protein [Candidatus Nezhaarchaeota archaeon]MCX8141191.1 helix-turn-helix domain-containing protein [Candidatus Nezhaarchaeota archaeon]MDW8049457.1 helix-turn-helix domain-containing protein [Nitrososphaerota archaeon]
MINEADLYKVYRALGNPHRRRIILLLGDNPDGLVFSELRRELNLSVGSLYYNLDQLKGLVHQKSDKRYVLTEKGVIAYKMLKSDVERVKRGEVRSESIDLTDNLRKIFFPRWFFNLLESRRNLTPIIAIITLLTGSLASWYNCLVLYITWISYSSIQALCLLSFLWTWLIVGTASFLIVPPYSLEKLKKLPLYLIEVGASMFPLALFVVLEPFLRPVIVLKAVVQVVLWLLSLLLISSALSHVTGCRGETALLVTAMMMLATSIIIPQMLSPPP